MIYSGGLESHWRLVIGVCITSIVWIATTFLTRPTDYSTLKSFYQLIQPHGGGWQPVLSSMSTEEKAELTEKRTNLSSEIAMVFLACILVYAALFGTGYLLYGQMTSFIIALVITVLAAFGLLRFWRSTTE